MYGRFCSSSNIKLVLRLGNYSFKHYAQALARKINQGLSYSEGLAWFTLESKLIIVLWDTKLWGNNHRTLWTGHAVFPSWEGVFSTYDCLGMRVTLWECTGSHTDSGGGFLSSHQATPTGVSSPTFLTSNDQRYTVITRTILLMLSKLTKKLLVKCQRVRAKA